MFPKEVFTSDEFEKHEKNVQRSQSSDSDPAGSGFNLNLEKSSNNNESKKENNSIIKEDICDDSDKNSHSSSITPNLPSSIVSTQSLIFVHEYVSWVSWREALQVQF